MANYDWLLDTEGEELGENVLKNIYLLTIKRKNVEGDKKSLLTLYVNNYVTSAVNLLYFIIYLLGQNDTM